MILRCCAFFGKAFDGALVVLNVIPLFFEKVSFGSFCIHKVIKCVPHSLFVNFVLLFLQGHQVESA